jgi:transcriptional regulator with XRE-family HTH domain
MSSSSTMRNPTFHARLKFFFRLSGLTMAEFARRAGVTRPCVSQWLAGRSMPMRKREPRVARALGVSQERFNGPLVKDASAEQCA